MLGRNGPPVSPWKLIQPKCEPQLLVKFSVRVECIPLQVGKTQFHKSHAFDFSGPVPVFVGDDKPGIGRLQPGMMVRTIICLGLHQEGSYYQVNLPRRTAVCSLREWGETSRLGLLSTGRLAPPLLLPLPLPHSHSASHSLSAGTEVLCLLSGSCA